ncbi:MAG: hypothetical protein Q9162_001968 [Coniocarpon cinnabarinum]
MWDRETLVQSASILLATLPIVFYLLPASIKPWPLTSHPPGNRLNSQPSSPDSETSTTGDDTDSKALTLPKVTNGSFMQVSKTNSPPRSTTYNGPSTHARPPPQGKDPSERGLMPPPPRPISKPSTSSGNALSVPTLSATPSRTSELARRGNPRAQRGPASSLAPPTINPRLASNSEPTSSTLPASARPRKKVVLAPGHSPLDWAHLTSSTPPHELAGVAHLQRVTPSVLAQHDGRKGRPAWSSFRGRVYNIGPYLDFHPGGVGELRRAAGKTGDKLFDEIHSWVNVENMLGACLVGLLVGENEDGRPGASSGLDSLD